MFLRRREIAEIVIAQYGEIEMGIGIIGLQRQRLLVSGARPFEMALLTIEHAEIIVSDGILRLPLDGALEGLLCRRPLAAPALMLAACATPQPPASGRAR